MLLFFHFSMTDFFYKRTKKQGARYNINAKIKQKYRQVYTWIIRDKKEESVRHTAEGIRCYDYSLFKRPRIINAKLAKQIMNKTCATFVLIFGFNTGLN